MLLCLKRIISNRSRLFSITVLLSAASCSYAFAEAVSTEEWNIAADKVIRYEDPNSLVAQGNVVLEKRQKLPPPPKKEQLLSSWSELLGEKPEEKEVAGDEAEKDAEPTLKTTVTIKADWMVYDVDMETIKAKGNVRVITGDDRLTASEGTMPGAMRRMWGNRRHGYPQRKITAPRGQKHRKNWLRHLQGCRRLGHHL